MTKGTSDFNEGFCRKVQQKMLSVESNIMG